MRSIFRLMSLIVMLLIPATAFAGTAPPTYGPVTDTTVSIGLRFEFGDVVKPSVVGAVRTTNTSEDNVVTGALFDVAVPFGPDQNFLPTIRLMGVFGNPDVQGLAGVGFEFGENQGILAVGAQIKHLEGGVHVGFDGSFAPYAGASTYGGPPERSMTTLPPPG
ncbi:hypothetical protein [Maritalea sp. S77]|uniref:hypothetical protein n=1 Tax=Maritalea sp. S77 TaxID=3415125 RepID=UPI003C7B6720